MTSRCACSNPTPTPTGTYCLRCGRPLRLDSDSLDSGRRESVAVGEGEAPFAAPKTYVEIKLRIEKKTMEAITRHVFARAMAQNSAVSDMAMHKILTAIDEGKGEVTLEAKKEIE